MELLFAAFHQIGVQDVVISPGSRSTPLAARALRAPGMTCHSIIDERAAAFFALGLARSTGRLPLLICTSGSAGAHYLPALIEARHSGIAVLALTADRPSELQDCGAPQTVVQNGLFGRFAPTFVLDEPCSSEDKASALVAQILTAGARARGPSPGPIHLNFPVGKPLEARAAATAEEEELQGKFSAIWGKRPAALHSSLAVPSRASLLQWAQSALPSSGRLLVTAGPIPHPLAAKVRRLAAQLGAPCALEHAQAGTGVPLDLLTAHWENASGPPLPTHVLHFGPPCVASAWGELLKRAPFAHYVVPGPEHLEPSRTAAGMLVGDLAFILDALLEMHAEKREQSPYLLEFSEYQEGLAARLSAAIASTRGPHLSEVEATCAVLRGASSAHQVLLGNSLPLRIASWVSPLLRSDATAGPRLVTARGANGIDGWVAAAAGATMGAGRPTVALLGDVTVAHDIASLALVGRCRAPLVLALVDNDGGRIFDHLPARTTLTDAEFTYWTTRPEVRFDRAAAAYGIPYHLAESVDAIEGLLPTLLDQARGSVLHVRADASRSRDFLVQARNGIG